MEAQLEEKNQELQRVSHACFSISFFFCVFILPLVLSVAFVRLYAAQGRTQF